MLELHRSTAFLATVERAKAYGRSARADATRRAYASDWRDFEAFCSSHGLAALPADSQTVALYLADLAGRRSVATVRRRVVALSQQHKSLGYAVPTTDAVVRDILKGIERTHGVAPHRKTALTADLLKEVLNELDESLPACRDRALLLVTFAGGFRRSEVAALDLGDIRFEKPGVVVTLRRSKTDQAGAEREVAIPRLRGSEMCAVEALEAWIRAAEILDGPLFRSFSMRGRLQTRRISGRYISRLVQRLVLRAGLDGDFSAHSLRAGFITSGAQRGVAEACLQKVTGHRSASVLRGYVRRATLFDDSPLARIFEERNAGRGG